MSGTSAVEALSKLLEAISENPYDLSLHVQHIRLAQESGDEEQAHAAREMFAGFWAVGDDVWLPLLDAKERHEDVDTPEGMQAVLAHYRRAEEDYLCM